MKYIIGIDIGGTKSAVVLGALEDGNPKILAKNAFPTEVEKGFEHTLNKLFKGVRDIIRSNDRNLNLSRIGISCGGPLNSKKGVILSPPNLPGWDNIPLARLFEDEFGIRVSLQNDANAGALAEWRFGAARGCRNVIFLTFGTGMGAGLILNGRLYSGTNDLAGEVGHICLSDYGPVGYGKAGSFEGFCSGSGLAELARMKVLEKWQAGVSVSFCKGPEHLEGLNAKLIAKAAGAGDGLAKEIYELSGRFLGKALSILIDILNPEIIVIGSIFARNRELLYPAALEVIRRESLQLSRGVCRIVPAALGDEIGDYAALAVALNE